MSCVDDDTASASVSGTSAPPDKKASVSPTKQTKNLGYLSGGRCLKCEEELGSDCKAMQCDLCAAWIHAKCEGLSDKVYDNIMVLGGFNNFMFHFIDGISDR